MHLVIYQPRVSYYVGGGEVVPLEQARYLSRMGWSVTILTSKAPFLEESDYFTQFKAANPKVEIKYLTIPTKLKWIYKTEPGINWERWDQESLAFAKLALPLLNQFRYNKSIIAVHNILDTQGVPVSVPSVLHLHGFPSQLNYACQLLLNQPQNLVSVSSHIKDKYVSFGVRSAITVHTNGISAKDFYPIEIAKQYDLLYIGRLVEIKGVQYLLQAVANLVHKKEHKDVKVAIAGQGPYREYLVSLVKKYQIGANIFFLGYIPEEEKNALYNQSRIVVLPSYAREGVLTTMLEASACGVPVVTCRNTSMAEFIRSNKNGVLVEPEDSESLEKAIRHLLASPELAGSLGKEARRDVLKNWTWETKAKELAHYYRSVCPTRI